MLSRKGCIGAARLATRKQESLVKMKSDYDENKDLTLLMVSSRGLRGCAGPTGFSSSAEAEKRGPPAPDLKIKNVKTLALRQTGQKRTVTRTSLST